jgi:hypothetical protein
MTGMHIVAINPAAWPNLILSRRTLAAREIISPRYPPRNARRRVSEAVGRRIGSLWIIALRLPTQTRQAYGSNCSRRSCSRRAASTHSTMAGRASMVVT